MSSLQEEETSKLLRMEEELHKRIISQDRAISALSRAIRRSRAGLHSPKRPVGSFLFLGPTGVGKTEMARSLAAFLFESEQALIRLDMSEYMEKHSVAKLIGSPPGYVGHEDGANLRKRSSAIPILSCCWMKLKRLIRMCTTCFCKFLRMGSSLIPTAIR